MIEAGKTYRIKRDVGWNSMIGFYLKPIALESNEYGKDIWCCEASFDMAMGSRSWTFWVPPDKLEPIKD